MLGVGGEDDATLGVLDEGADDAPHAHTLGFPFLWGHGDGEAGVAGRQGPFEGLVDCFEGGGLHRRWFDGLGEGPGGGVLLGDGGAGGFAVEAVEEGGALGGGPACGFGEDGAADQVGVVGHARDGGGVW